ncbi:MAG: HEAT repeat domain-containing protein [Myxococcaceae bacterium]|nr:HEAT repeat domain-containing protein [Myxococcaceae bacterium]MCA3014451.1 HEAT repeat domain-containing protein [Myxococcaceae bacterium]
MSDPKLKKQVEMARSVAYHLLKGIKMIGMYRHNEAKYGEFLAKAHESLTQYLEEHGALALKVDLTNFLLHKQELFTDESTLPYKYFKDGIRQLIFRPGFTIEELTSFTVISLSDPDRGAEDLNAQLWRAQMPNFEYIMVEGFRMDEFSEEEVQVEVDKVVDYLQRRLRTASDDYLRFARVSETDLDMKLDNVEQMRGVVITGVTADATLKARLQKDVHDEENQRLFPKLISAVFQVVESGVDDAELLTDMFTQLLDAMLLQEDFTIINQVVLKLKAMEQRAGSESAIGRLLRSFLLRMGEEQRLNRVADVLKFQKLKNTGDVVRYLSNLGPDTVPMLLDALEVIELAENRTLLCDVLVPHAKEFPDPFVNRLKSEKPQMVRDMIYILDRSNHPEKLKFFATVLKTKNMAVKLEVMAIIARGRTGDARKLISSALEDESQQVRIQAARVLPEFDRDKAFLDLMKIVKDPAFEKRSPQEHEAFYSAIGSTGVQGALAYFVQLLQQKPGLFNKDKIMRDKLLAVAGLGGACTIQTAKLLQEIVEDKSQAPEVINHARLHLGRVRKVLFGSAEKEG